MSEVITSANNPTVKQLRKLFKSSKERRETNSYIAEGVHLVQSYLASGQTPKMYAYAVGAQNNHEVAELIEELGSTDAKSVVVADTVFESLSSVHASNGIFIVFSAPDQEKITTLSENAVLLEDIQDPGNLGTILRTTAAAGIKRVLLSSSCSSPWSPKTLRAGMGAQFGLSIYEDVDLGKLIEASSAITIATVLSSDSKMIYDLDLKRPILWLFGSEGQGVSDDLAKRASIRTTIPQADTSIESLNVASAAAICLYEQYRQNLHQ